jgi:hypothetical protein
MKRSKGVLVTLMTAIFLVCVMGTFSDANAKGKFGRLKYNPEVIPKFASSAPLPEDINIYFSGPADRPF